MPSPIIGPMIANSAHSRWASQTDSSQISHQTSSQDNRSATTTPSSMQPPRLHPGPPQHLPTTHPRPLRKRLDTSPHSETTNHSSKPRTVQRRPAGDIYPPMQDIIKHFRSPPSPHQRTANHRRRRFRRGKPGPSTTRTLANTRHADRLHDRRPPHDAHRTTQHLAQMHRPRISNVKTPHHSPSNPQENQTQLRYSRQAPSARR